MAKNLDELYVAPPRRVETTYETAARKMRDRNKPVSVTPSAPVKKEIPRKMDKPTSGDKLNWKGGIIGGVLCGLVGGPPGAFVGGMLGSAWPKKK